MSHLCVYVLIKKRDEVQIIHANFVSSSVMILSEIPKIVFIKERRKQLVKEWMCLRFRDQYLSQPPIPFIFRDDGFRGRL
jgi:hypothetical protein